MIFNMTVDKSYFPGWVRKSITFTIDDGNIELDKKFIDIVKKGGIKGTFNLCAPDLKKYTPELYRELYRGYGISNHCKLHPFAFTPEKPTEISEDKSEIRLDISIDTEYSSVSDYFEIFLARMILCRKAAERLGLKFRLFINSQQLM